MRLLYIPVFCLLVIAGCSGGHTEQVHGALPEALKEQALDLGGFNPHNVLLINEVGVVSLYLPAAMDTFFTYADYGQYHCGETKQYRFADKNFDPDRGLDQSYSDPTDSLYQLTILQTYNPDCESYTDVDEKMLTSLQGDKSHTYTMDTIKGRKIIVGVMQKQQDTLKVVEVTAITSVNGRKVSFVFQCFKKSAGNFVNQAITSIRTIEIKKQGS